MKSHTAQKKSLIATTKNIAGHTVYSMAYGHKVWLEDVRKNKILTIPNHEADDFSMAEICFAFTKDPLALQSFTGAKATKEINDFLLGNPASTLIKIFTHAADEYTVYRSTLTTQKKTGQSVKKKPIPQARKR